MMKSPTAQFPPKILLIINPFFVFLFIYHESCSAGMTRPPWFVKKNNSLPIARLIDRLVSLIGFILYYLNRSVKGKENNKKRPLRDCREEAVKNILKPT